MSNIPLTESQQEDIRGVLSRLAWVWDKKTGYYNPDLNTPKALVASFQSFASAVGRPYNAGLQFRAALAAALPTQTEAIRSGAGDTVKGALALCERHRKATQPKLVVTELDIDQSAATFEFFGVAA